MLTMYKRWHWIISWNWKLTVFPYILHRFLIFQFLLTSFRLLVSVTLACFWSMRREHVSATLRSAHTRGHVAKTVSSCDMPVFAQKLCCGDKQGSITSRCSGKEPALLPQRLLGEERRPDSRERWKSSLGRNVCIRNTLHEIQLVWIRASWSRDKMTSIFNVPSFALLLQTAPATTKKWTNIHLVCTSLPTVPATCVLCLSPRHFPATCPLVCL